MKSQPTLPLPHNQVMPQLGFGTFKLTGEEGTEAIRTALECGYRHLDTAAMYANHREAGEGLRRSGVARNEVFITSKVWHDKLHYDGVVDTCLNALEEIGTKWLDLYLVHWPNEEIPMEETFRAMADLISDGRIRNFGVSNFTVRRLREALAETDAPVAVNQVEYHVHLNQEKLLRFCRENGIRVVAYCPLGSGRLVNDPELEAIGKAHGKTAAQTALRWLLQKGISPIPKATARARIQSNFAVLDWSLSDDEMRRIDALHRNERICDWDRGGFDADDPAE
ncbi:MAG: aldo/keto reductase [Opitutales bacterium]|nr:aldo/keto reductase [Opitutales bacterium]